MKSSTSYIDPESSLFRILDTVADATNILLAVWVLVILVIGTRRSAFGPKTWAAVVLSVAWVYVLKTVDSRLDIWEGFNSDYSTHSALAAALALSLFFLDLPRRILALAVLGVYLVLIYVLGFHTVVDIVTTLAVIVPIVVAMHLLVNKKSAVAVT